LCFDYFYVDVTTGVDDYEKVNDRLNKDNIDDDDDDAADDDADDVVDIIISIDVTLTRLSGHWQMFLNAEEQFENLT